MNDIIKHDRVVFIKGNNEGNKGYVTRVEDDMACVVITGGWNHGIWFDLNELKRTKRYKKEQG